MLRQARRYAERMDDEALHHNDPERVIPTIEAELRPLVHELLAAGFEVVDASGPVQMAVANLLLERGGTRVLFEAERGFSSVRLTRDERSTWLGAALAAWARCPGSDGRPHAADLTPWSQISTFSWDMRVHRSAGLEQQATYGMAVCDWLPDADLGAIDAVEAETGVLFAWPQRMKKDATPDLVAARYRDALDRYFASRSTR
jgi:hypothetical protein